MALTPLPPWADCRGPYALETEILDCLTSLSSSCSHIRQKYNEPSAVGSSKRSGRTPAKGLFIRQPCPACSITGERCSIAPDANVQLGPVSRRFWPFGIAEVQRARSEVRCSRFADLRDNEGEGKSNPRRRRAGFRNTESGVERRRRQAAQRVAWDRLGPFERALLPRDPLGDPAPHEAW